MTGLDQLHHLGTKTCQAAFTVKGSQNGPGGLIKIAGRSCTDSSGFPEGLFGLESGTEILLCWRHCRQGLGYGGTCRDDESGDHWIIIETR